MSFQQGLSGLNGAAKSLDVIGNNIANASTVGFKGSTRPSSPTSTPLAERRRRQPGRYRHQGGRHRPAVHPG
jgi:flagellar basal body rod protein FlgG